MGKVWLITGCSTGFGRALAKEVLERGYHAAITARRPSDIQDIVDSYPSTALSISLDVTNAGQIKDAVMVTLEKFGSIDVLVNNAGVGYFGALEESEEDAVRNMFEINFFGLAKMIQECLPIMRKQKSGHIINISSIGGLIGYPALGFYNATKFAVDGLSESLSKEVGPLGIKVTIVAPSGFRTDWAGRSAHESPIVIDDYVSTAGANRAAIKAYNGKQPGDPERAAKAIVKVVESSEPPLRLLLGAAAFKNAMAKLDVLKKDFEGWQETSIGADYPKA